MSETYHKAYALLKYAEKYADDVQVEALSQKEKVLLLLNNKIETLTYGETKGYYVKVIKDKRQGIASGDVADHNLVKSALKIAKTSPKLPHYYGLPSKRKAKRAKVYDKNMAFVDFNNLTRIGRDFIQQLRGYNILSIKTIVNETESMILNSNGVDCSEIETNNSIGASVSTKSNISLWKTASERKVICYPAFGEALISDLKRLRKPEPLRKQVDDVVFSPVPFSEIIVGAFLSNLDLATTNSRFRRNHDFKSDIGIKDVGNMDYGIMSSTYDDDGVPTGETQLIKNGILKEKINDYQTAKRFRTAPTGNAGGFSNVIISGRQKLKGIDKGVLVTAVLGEDNSNPLTTEYNVEVDRAFMIEHGEITGPVNEFTLSGRFTDLMKNIAGYGKDVTNVHGYYLPSIHVSGLKAKPFRY